MEQPQIVRPRHRRAGEGIPLASVGCGRGLLLALDLRGLGRNGHEAALGFSGADRIDGSQHWVLLSSPLLGFPVASLCDTGMLLPPAQTAVASQVLQIWLSFSPRCV